MAGAGVTNQRRSHIRFSCFSRLFSIRIGIWRCCKCKFNVKHRECLCNHPSQRLMIKCLTIPDRIGIWKCWAIPAPPICWFLCREENRRTQRKTLGAGQEPGHNGGMKALPPSVLPTKRLLFLFNRLLLFTAKCLRNSIRL